MLKNVKIRIEWQQIFILENLVWKIVYVFLPIPNFLVMRLKILNTKKTRNNPLKPIAFKLLLLLALIQGALAKYFNIKKKITSACSRPNNASFSSATSSASNCAIKNSSNLFFENYALRPHPPLLAQMRTLMLLLVCCCFLQDLPSFLRALASRSPIPHWFSKFVWTKCNNSRVSCGFRS